MLALIGCGADVATLLTIKTQGSNKVMCCKRPRDVIAGSTAARGGGTEATDKMFPAPKGRNGRAFRALAQSRDLLRASCSVSFLQNEKRDRFRQLDA